MARRRAIFLAVIAKPEGLWQSYYPPPPTRGARSLSSRRRIETTGAGAGAGDGIGAVGIFAYEVNAKVVTARKGEYVRK